MLRRVNYRLRAEEARRSSEEPIVYGTAVAEEPIVYGTAVAVGEVVAAVTGVPVAPLVEPVAAEPPTPEAGMPALPPPPPGAPPPPVSPGSRDINVDAWVQRVAAQQRERVSTQEFEQSAARVSERENGVESHDLKPI